MLPEAATSRSEELWLIALAVGSLAVVLLAVLFGLVIAVLQRIDRHAARTHTAAKQIAQNTVALWTLEQTNRDLVAIRDAARGAARGGVSTAASKLDPVKEKIQGWLGGPDDDGGDKGS